MFSFSGTIHPVDFSRISGNEFERLVFAVLLRMYSWRTLDWYGQTGSDGGRDIIGERDNDWGRNETVIVACANWRSFTSTKGINDIDSLSKAVAAPPAEVILIAGRPVSPKIKRTCEMHAIGKGIHSTKVWSGPEFEEMLRFHAPSVAERFFRGVALPDEAGQLTELVLNLDAVSSREAAELLVRLFDRPAFRDKIWQESSLPAFRRAIEDTIGALNTGVWRDREGALISRIPSRHQLPIQEVREALAMCVKQLRGLRTAFDNGLRTEEIKPCGCEDKNCPTYFMNREVATRLTQLRADALESAERAIDTLRAVTIDTVTEHHS